MRINRSTLLFFCLVTGGSIFLLSCKERNKDFPPHPWSEYFYHTSAIAARTVSAIFYENDHSVWLGAQGKEGLLLKDGYTWNAYNKANTGFEMDSVTSISRDGNGTLWVGWKTGLAEFNGNSWHKIMPFDGLCVTSIAVEGIGNIEVGIKGEKGGLAIFRDNTWTFYSLSNSSIPSQNIVSLSTDHDQLLWMATTDKGIIRLKNNQWEMMSIGIPLLSQNFTSITTSPDGSIWAGSTASQLIHYSENKFTVLNTGTSKSITSLVVADDGSVWCCTSGAGLIKYDGSVWTSFTVENAALPTNEILSIAKGTSGNLFFSIPGGKVLMIRQ